MRCEKPAFTGILAVAAVLGLGSCVQAQVGDGWIQHFPSVCLEPELHDQLYVLCPAPDYYDDGEGLCHYDISFHRHANLEAFALYRAASNRIEIRVRNDYTQGLRQFQGWVHIEPPTDNECVMQIFGGQTSATAAMFRAFNTQGGQLRHYTSSSQTIASGIYGTWTQLNALHDADAGQVYAYVNGQFAGQWADHGPANHYFKYGIYGTHNDATAAYVWWFGVKFFYQ
jgi:hypothetical protein